MEKEKRKIEAVLFTTGRFLGIKEVSEMTGIASLGFLKDVLNELKENYEKLNSSLEITREQNQWKLGLKKEFLYLTEGLLTSSELDRPVQETLAMVAYKQPAIQSDVINIRGNKAYDHIKVLRENGFLESEKFGRTKILKLTQKFYDYFDVVEDSLKQTLEVKGDLNDQKE